MAPGSVATHLPTSAEICRTEAQNKPTALFRKAQVPQAIPFDASSREVSNQLRIVHAELSIRRRNDGRK